MCVYIYIYIHTHTHIYIYIHMAGRPQEGIDEPVQIHTLVRVVEGPCRPVNTTNLPLILPAADSGSTAT